MAWAFGIGGAGVAKAAWWDLRLASLLMHLFLFLSLFFCLWFDAVD